MASTEPVTCTRCGKLSPPRTTVCGCGFRFGAGGQRALVGERVRARDAAWWTAAAGGGIATIGLGLTVATFLNPTGGSAIVFYGMILVGSVWVIRGLTKLHAIDALPPIPPDDPGFGDDDDDR